MKKSLALLLLLSFSFSIQAQKKQTKKKVVPVVEEVAVEAVAVEAIEEGYNSDGEIKLVQIAKGKKYAFIIDIRKSSVIDENNREEKELLANFKKEDLVVIPVYVYTNFIFENNQTLDLDQQGTSYKSIAYWSGKMSDDVKVLETDNFATEFIAKQMNVSKKSSYVTKTELAKKEIAEHLKGNKITKNSKTTLEALLRMYASPLPGKSEQEKTFASFKPKNIKTLDTYIYEGNKKKIKIKSVVFNENNQPTLLSYFRSDGTDKYNIKLIYDTEGMLNQIIDGERTTTVNYNDDKVIFSNDNESEINKEIYTLQDNNLLKKSYTLNRNDDKVYENYFYDETVEMGCIVYTSNYEIWKKICYSKENTFPFMQQYIKYQDGKLLQYNKNKIEKKDANTYLNYYSIAKNESEIDEYKLWGTYTFNDNQELIKYDFVKDGENKKAIVEYTYFK